jgi:hypothetical protein
MPTVSRLVVCGLIVTLAVLGGTSIAAGQGTQDRRTLVVGVAFDIKSLDPARAFEPAGVMILKATYDTLLTLDEHDVSKIVPDLAASWEVSPDARTFTFHLRSSVTFPSSGNPMTSADVKWSLERAMGIHGNPSFLLDGITSIETPDDYIVVISKSDPDPAFIAKSSSPVFAVLDSKTVQVHGGVSGPDAATTDAAEDWLNQNSAGTGPFSLTSYTPESEIDLQGSSTFWNGPPPFDRVIYRNIPDAATQKLTLEAGGIDIATTVSADQVPSLQANPNVSVVEGPSPLIFYLMMNEQADLSHGTVSKPDVQQAVRYALAYDGINTLIRSPAVTPPSVLPQGFCHVPGPDYWPEVRRICDRYGVLLIMDEVINGWGRTGTLFGAQHFGVIPDIMTMAKGLSSGYAPIAATVVRPALFADFQEGERRLAHLLTFGGHAVACAVALENIEIIQRERLVDNSARVGDYLLARLRRLSEHHPTIGDVRGRGLMCALDLVKDRASRMPWGKGSPFQARLGDALAERGLLIRILDVVVIAPPLIVTEPQIDEIVAIFDEALTEVEREYGMS